MNQLKTEMTFEEYLEFLDDYWKLFGPIPEKPNEDHLYTNIKL